MSGYLFAVPAPESTMLPSTVYLAGPTPAQYLSECFWCSVLWFVYSRVWHWRVLLHLRETKGLSSAEATKAKILSLGWDESFLLIVESTRRFLEFLRTPSRAVQSVAFMPHKVCRRFPSSWSHWLIPCVPKNPAMVQVWQIFARINFGHLTAQFIKPGPEFDCNLGHTVMWREHRGVWKKQRVFSGPVCSEGMGQAISTSTDSLQEQYRQCHQDLPVCWIGMSNPFPALLLKSIEWLDGSQNCLEQKASPDAKGQFLW